MSSPRGRITYQDYLQLPDEQRYEVLEGVLCRLPTPPVMHQQVLGNLVAVIDKFVEKRSLGSVYFGPLDVILDEDTVVQPDLLVIRKERLSILKREGVRGAPDLVVEVLSPSNAHRDRGIKRQLYGRYGVQEYWFVDPQEHTVEVTVQQNGALQTVGIAKDGEGVRSALFPDLFLEVASLFAEC